MKNQMHKNRIFIILLACGLISISILCVLFSPIIFINILNAVFKLINLDISHLPEFYVVISLARTILLILGIYGLWSSWQVLICYTKTGFTTRPDKIWQIGLFIGVWILIQHHIFVYFLSQTPVPRNVSYFGWTPEFSLTLSYFLDFIIITAPLLTGLTLIYLLYYPYLFKKIRMPAKKPMKPFKKRYKSWLVISITAGLISPTVFYILMLPWSFMMITIDLALFFTRPYMPAFTLSTLLTGYGLWSCWKVLKHYKTTDFATSPKRIWQIGMTVMLGSLIYYSFLIKQPDDDMFSNLNMPLGLILIIILPMISILVLFSLFFIAKFKNK